MFCVLLLFDCIIIAVQPLDVEIVTNERALRAGLQVEWTCQSTGSRPPASISWWLDGVKMTQSREHLLNGGNVTISTLKMIPKIEDGGRELLCRATNPVTRVHIEETRTLLVHCKHFLSSILDVFSKSQNDS